MSYLDTLQRGDEVTVERVNGGGARQVVVLSVGPKWIGLTRRGLSGVKVLYNRETGLSADQIMKVVPPPATARTCEATHHHLDGPVPATVTIHGGVAWYCLDCALRQARIWLENGDAIALQPVAAITTTNGS